MLAGGDPLKAMQIYYTVPLSFAYKCAQYLLKLEKEKEYNRQRLFAVINRSLGGDYSPDESLLKEECKADKKGIKRNWLRLAEKMGANINNDIKARLLNG